MFMVKNVAEKGCFWHFDKQTGSDIGPNDAMGEPFKRMPYESLVRESIQNSLDAVDDHNKPVEIEFRIRSLKCRDYPELFNLKEHIEGCLDMYNTKDAQRKFEPMLDYLNNSNKESLQYLSVSDKNTIGMDYRKNDPKSPFYAFVRSKGVSAKANSSAGGAFGFGKAAYFNVSKIRTVFISTKTKDGKTFFEGEASLCTHKVNGKKLVDTGFYDNNNGNPMSGEENIPSRFFREYPGTDINIMGIELSTDRSGSIEKSKNKVYDEIRKAVLKNFFLSIYDKKLTVLIGDEEFNAKNIKDVVDKEFLEEEDQNRGYGNCKPYLEAVMLANSDKNHVLVSKEIPVLGKVNFYVLKKKTGTNRILYMRSPRMLVDAVKNPNNYGFYGVFLCDDPRGNDILRQMEGSAHREWDPKQATYNLDKAKEAYLSMSNFILDSLVSIFANNSGESLGIVGLENYLYIPTESDDDDDNIETVSGNPTGDVRDDGSSFTGYINPENPTIEDSPVETSIGKVTISKPNKGTPSTKGSMMSGHSKKHRKTHGGGAPGSHDVDTMIEQDEEGTPGSYATAIDVAYRTFAYVKNGEFWHRIIIRSNYEIKNGRIEVLVAGEQTDDEAIIKKTTEGTADGCQINGLTLHEGKNVFDIQFESNMKYALKLAAYEIK